VAQAGGSAGLIEEPLAEGGLACDIGTEELDGDRAVKADITGEEDNAHAPPSDLPLEGVAADQCALQSEEQQIVVQGVGHASLR
jgi:hypothetical protein